MASHEQVRQGCQHIDLAAVLEHATQAGLLKAELPLDHAEWVLTGAYQERSPLGVLL